MKKKAKRPSKAAVRRFMAKYGTRVLKALDEFDRAYDEFDRARFALFAKGRA